MNDNGKLSRMVGKLKDGSEILILHKDGMYAAFHSSVQREKAFEGINEDRHSTISDWGCGWRTCWCNMGAMLHHFPDIEIIQEVSYQETNKFEVLNNGAITVDSEMFP